MLFYTHLILALFSTLLILDHVENKVVFVLAVLVSTLLPDIDSGNSRLGRNFFSKVFTAFTKHRGFIHSFTFVLIVYFILILYLPIIANAFLFGYSIHLLADCFTLAGVRLFYPLNFRIRGFIRTGGMLEGIIYVLFLVGSLILLALRFFN